MNALPVRLTVNEAWQKWHDERASDARDVLVVHYASLIKFVAGRLSANLPKQVDTGDLIQAGVFGLIGAIEKFDPDNGAKFETYAIPRIRGAILDSLRQLDWVPRTVRSRSRDIENAISTLEHELGRSPVDEEIAARLGIALDELHGWLADAHLGSVGPLDHVMADGRATDTHSDMHMSTNPDAVIESGEIRRVMLQEMKKLPERERNVLVLYYEENLTLSEIGEVLGVTESRVSQIHSRAVLQLRSRLRSQDVA
jgi:RNA polymerase sigma factor for flagellar operon FliA